MILWLVCRYSLFGSRFSHFYDDKDEDKVHHTPLEQRKNVDSISECVAEEK